MASLLRALIVLATAGALSFPSQPPTANAPAQGGRHRAIGTPSSPVRAQFTPAQLEYYLTDDGIAYIRPGLKVKVNSVTIGADRKPVVDLTLTDNFDQPLDRAGKVTPGAISVSFILASYDPNTRYYTAYTTRTVKTPADSPHPNVTSVQAGTDSGGKPVDVAQGHFQYTFKTVLPEGFDQTKTHTLGIYATRNLTEEIGKNYYANVEYDFRPDGNPVVETWDKMHDASTCLKCHDPLEAHGGSRRDVKLCVLCHNPQTIDPDTGNSVDMPVMIHKIHSGESLSTPYVIIGHGQSVVDFSEVTYPQDRRNCDTCHEGGDVADRGVQADAWYTHPSRRACGACHDDIDFATGEGHAAGPQASDVACSTCHVPDSGDEFDASIKAAHTIPTRSHQLAGLKSEIVSVTNVKPGEKPTITFKLTDKNGAAVDGSKLSTFAPIHAGPASSFTTYFRESNAAAAVFDAATGLTSYTFTNPIPADAKGTWAFSGDFYKTTTIKRADGQADITGVRDAAINPVKYVTFDGSAPTPRRQVVSIDLCNNCHDTLALHGGQRMVIDECTMCHNPTMDDKSVRVSGTGEPESISFQRMVHRIHTGTELTRDFTIYGNRSSVNNYNGVTYPGTRTNCAACHINNSQQIPAPLFADPVITLRDFFSPQGTATAACLGCHDGRDAAAHAYLNTTTFAGQPAEACGVCHGEGSDWAVDKVHAR